MGRQGQAALRRLRRSRRCDKSRARLSDPEEPPCSMPPPAASTSSRRRPSTTTAASTTLRSTAWSISTSSAASPASPCSASWARRRSSTQQEARRRRRAQVIRRAASCRSIVGVSAPGFAAMRALARDVMDAGAAGVMIAPPPSLRTDDQIVTYYRQAVEAIGADVPFVHPGLSAHASACVMTPAVIRRIVDGESVLRDAQARGLAGPGEDLGAARLRGATARCGRSRSCAAMAACSSTSRWSAAPTAP